MPTPRKPDTPDETKRILDRVARETDSLGASALRRAAEQAREHLGAGDKPETDAIEVWGTRIGRILSVVAFVLLAIWLASYLLRGA